MCFERIGTSPLSLDVHTANLLGWEKIEQDREYKVPRFVPHNCQWICPRTLELLLVWDYLNVTGV